MAFPQSPRTPPRQPAHLRRGSRKVMALLVALAAVGSALWYFVLHTPEESEPALPRDPGAGLRRFEEERPLMGTKFGIVVYAFSETAAKEAMNDAFARASEIEEVCSDYNPESELSRLSTIPVNQPTPVSQTLATVLAHARVTAELTEGAYDPTLGPLTALWRRSREEKALPSGDELTAAMARTGWQHLTVKMSNRTVTLHRPDMRLDLGGIAKGFAADEMYSILIQHGLTSAFVAAGGDIRLGHPPPGESSWKVGLRTLGAETEDFIRVSNCAVSTSGDLHQFLEIDGQRYSHILDPTTGLGLTRRVAATVIAPLATQSDPYATFACVMPDIAFASFNAADFSVRIVTEVGSTRRDQKTINFPKIEEL